MYFCAPVKRLELALCLNGAALPCLQPINCVFKCSSHVMNELLETERAYVEELLCVLEVSAPRVTILSKICAGKEKSRE